MYPDLDAILEAHGGACSRAQLLAVMSEARLGNEIRGRRLSRVFPRAYARPWRVDEVDVREKAAIVSVGAPVAISHTTALRRWGATIDDSEPLHVTIPATRRVQNAPGLVIHRTHQRLSCVERRGVLTALPEYAATQAWAVSPQGRAHLIETVRLRLTTPARIRSVAEAATRLPRRGELLRLVDLLAGGCESELEIWGHLRVFDAPGLRHGRQQVVVRVAGHRYRIDRAYEAEKVAVELDGDRFHSTREQRERDRRRDVALATIGWLTVRFSHSRLTRDPNGCQRELLAILARR